jgi:CRISPR type I-E-associated protein CasB/Cse2
MTTANHTADREEPAWHGRLAQQLYLIGQDPGLAHACRLGLNTQPLDVFDMHAPISYVLEGGENTEHSAYVPLAQREDVIFAVHHALALYAAHQQSKSASMHRPGVTVGEAARQLNAKMPSKDGAVVRFRAIHSADSTTELLGWLRGLVSLLRTYSIPLDYVALADALAAWPHLERRNGLRRHWGMAFQRTPAKTLTSNTPE